MFPSAAATARRRALHWTPLVATLTLVLTLLAPAGRAGAETGLEQYLGPIPDAVRAALPADRRLWVGYTPMTTPDPCPKGNGACIDRTIATMRGRFQTLAPQCDHNAVFSLLYLRVTEHYREVVTQPGFFLKPRTVNRENTIFAHLYFRADQRWHDDRPFTVSPIWRLAFAAADAREVQGVGDAFLGMAAHIRRDLPFALWKVSMGEHADHLAVNRMLEQVYPSVSAELARRLDPTFTPASIVPGTGKTLVEVIATWREQAWRDAQALVAAGSTAKWNAVAKRIERTAWETGVQIYLGAKYTPQSLTEFRDTYCAAHWDS